MRLPDGADISNLRQLVARDGPPAVKALLKDDRTVRGSVGQPPHFADVPWIAVWPPGADGLAYSGFYLVYLFAADGSAVYLSLNQGTENVWGGTQPLAKRALDLRAVSGVPADEQGAISLHSSAQRPRKYEAANATPPVIGTANIRPYAPGI
jgi:5-methylcytosine-specific restriction enzyme MrcB-like protein